MCLELGIPLHRVDFSASTASRCSPTFSRSTATGRTPNPDVLCNRQHQVRRHAALRAAARRHEHRDRPLRARDHRSTAYRSFCKGVDDGKDQTYFLHAVAATSSPTCCCRSASSLKRDVRAIARQAGLPVAEKKDSTGICFIGERPFAEFLAHYLPATRASSRRRRARARPPPWPRLLHARPAARSSHRRQRGPPETPWYVARKNRRATSSSWCRGASIRCSGAERSSRPARWIGPPPREWHAHEPLRSRRRSATASRTRAAPSCGRGRLARRRVRRAAAHADAGSVRRLLLDGDRCVGGATIDAAAAASPASVTRFFFAAAPNFPLIILASSRCPQRFQ